MNDLKKEISIYKTKVKDNFPASKLPFNVLCTWTAIYSNPFKFINYKLYTYTKNIPHNAVFSVRKEYLSDLNKMLAEDRYLTENVSISASFWKSVGNFFSYLASNYHKHDFKEVVWKKDENLYQEQKNEILKNFPEFLEYNTYNKADKNYTLSIKSINYQGIITGKYYYDIHGYFWLEIYPFFIPGISSESTAWVRETSINYATKEDLQKWINDNRPKKAEAKKKNTLLALGLFLLTSLN